MWLWRGLCRSCRCGSPPGGRHVLAMLKKQLRLLIFLAVGGGGLLHMRREFSMCHLGSDFASLMNSALEGSRPHGLCFAVPRPGRPTTREADGNIVR